MKKELKIVVIILGIASAVILGVLLYARMRTTEEITNEINISSYENTSEINSNNYEDNENMKVKMKAVVVKLDDKSLLVMNTKDKALIRMGTKEVGNIEYKEGQELLIYYDGVILTSYPEQFSSIGKIEIIKEKSDIEIPEKVLKYCYNSRDKVNINIEELTRNSITLSITDTNELPYNFAHTYVIEKQVKNENYTGVGYKIEATQTATQSSTSAYIRTGFRIYF